MIQTHVHYPAPIPSIASGGTHAKTVGIELGETRLVQKAMGAAEITLRDLEKRTGYSYEHLRKIVAGLPVVSEVCNEKLCTALGLNAKRMWEHALSDKTNAPSNRRRMILPPDEPRWKALWEDLLPSDHERITRAALAIAAANRAVRELEDSFGPKHIEELIGELISRLTRPRARPQTNVSAMRKAAAVEGTHEKT